MKQKTTTIVNRNIPITETFSSQGYVLGNYWGGGKGSFSAKKLVAYCSEEALLADAEKMLKDGSLDAGMGYESLIGARIEVTHKKTMVIDGEVWVYERSVGHFVGDLTEEQQDFLDEVTFNN